MNLPNLKELLDGLLALLRFLFGSNLPQWVIWTSRIALGLTLLLLALWGLLSLISKIRETWVTSVRPMFYDEAESALRFQRQLFARHVVNEVSHLNLLESWHDERFTELEAEVEASGTRRSKLRWFRFAKDGPAQNLRREHSLSLALRNTHDRLIVLEGEPGGGKSVAIRHLSLQLAERAAKAKNLEAVIPLYINLKEFSVDPALPLDKAAVRAFVISFLNRINDRDIEEFLENHFDSGMRSGRWLFLFDSFDEIPAILSATEADQAVHTYTNAISDFLHGFNTCRGVIASRAFKGPASVGFPRFRILPLSEKRQRKLIRQFGLTTTQQTETIRQVSAGNPEIRVLASNPMFLGLICTHIKSELPFPKHSHSLLEHYLERRLARDEDRLWKRFGLHTSDVRTCAENVAFTMSCDEGLGLSPGRQELRFAMHKLGLGDPALDLYLDALEYLKFARPESPIPGHRPAFTFAHRRFQEYFATRVVLREPTRVSVSSLLTDGRWRETAVVLCQTQPVDQLQSLVAEAERILAVAISILRIQLKLRRPSKATSFPWPPHVLHLLGILQSGFQGRIEELPQTFVSLARRILMLATKRGNLLDAKWALEVSAVLPRDAMYPLIRRAFAAQSSWLRDVAFLQVGRIPDLTPELEGQIRNLLVDMSHDGRLHKERFAVETQLERLSNGQQLLRAFRLLSERRMWDIGINLLILGCLLLLSRSTVTENNEYVQTSILGLYTLFIITIALRLGEGFFLFRAAFIMVPGMFMMLNTMHKLEHTRPEVGLKVLLSWILLAYGCSWGFLALSIAARSRVPPRILWGFIPLTSIVRNRSGIFAKLTRLVAMGGIGFIGLALVTWGFKLVRSIVDIPAWLGGALAVIPYVFIGGTLIFSVAAVIVISYPAVRDYAHDARVWSRIREPIPEVDALYTSWMSLRTSGFRTLLLRRVRRTGLPKEPKTLRTLRLLAEHCVLKDSGWTPSANLTDEIFRLIEQHQESGYSGT